MKKTGYGRYKYIKNIFDESNDFESAW